MKFKSSVFVLAITAFSGTLCVGRDGPTQANPATEMIVFVRSNPSASVQATEVIRDVNIYGVGDTHTGPQFEALSSNNSKRDEIAVMNPDGKGITELHVSGSDPSISPDGKKIAYCSSRQTVYFQIYVMDADGKNPRQLTNFSDGDACSPVWSHDGTKIAFHTFALSHPSRHPAVWAMAADGSNQKKLSDGVEPAWSPDDRRIAYASNPDRVFHIYVMNADGSNPHRVSKESGEASSPSWAPDGATIAFSSETEGDRRGLFLVVADGSEQRRLAFSKHQDFCFPAWSLDGKDIIFTALTRLGSQGIEVGEEKPRCEMWSGEYQIFTLDGEGKVHRLTDAKLMAKHASYGRLAQ